MLLVACSPPGSPSDGSIGQTTGAQTPQTTCPAPTNDVPLDLEMGIPLAYLSGLGIFNVYWGENWDSLPGSLQRADIDKALKDVVATTYFDKLRQYGVPGLHFEGSATTGGFLYPCQGSPGPVTWIDFSSGTSKGGFDITKVLSLFKKGEAADICQDMGLSEVDHTAADGTVFGVAPYWSNADNACVPGQAAPPTDTTAPVTTASGAPPANGSGWNDADVTVTLTATDPGSPSSGIKEIDLSATGAQPVPATTVPANPVSVFFAVEGITDLTFHAVDNAGNVEADKHLDIRIDKTPPVVTWTGNAGTYGVGDTVAITCSATDALSGLASSTCADVNGPASSFGLGPHTFTATAMDLAGNSTTVSITFTVEVTAQGLCDLVREDSTDPRLAAKLCRILNEGAALPPDCCKALRKLLGEFVEEVVDHIPAAFTPQQAQTLIDDALTLVPTTCPQPANDHDDDDCDDRCRTHRDDDDSR
ncbi:MAG TPA: hypothetical protein VMH40_14740, partial [Myxococcaceae bacterium]|nr:hypothetical protein [Myxococcaceae bacterium]